MVTNRNFNNLLITAINLENVMNTAKNQDTTATAEFPTWPGSTRRPSSKCAYSEMEN